MNTPTEIIQALDKLEINYQNRLLKYTILNLMCHAELYGKVTVSDIVKFIKHYSDGKLK